MARSDTERVARPKYEIGFVMMSRWTKKTVGRMCMYRVLAGAMC